MKILLDTSAYVGFKRNMEDVVATIIKADTILFSPIVLGELLFGFRNGARFTDNTRELEAFLAHDHVAIVPLTDVTADRYSRIAAHMKHQGTPIPTNDIWIAAQVVEHGAELITLDSHFSKIAGLVHTVYRQEEL